MQKTKMQFQLTPMTPTKNYWKFAYMEGANAPFVVYVPKDQLDNGTLPGIMTVEVEQRTMRT